MSKEEIAAMNVVAGAAALGVVIGVCGLIAAMTAWERASTLRKRLAAVEALQRSTLIRVACVVNDVAAIGASVAAFRRDVEALDDDKAADDAPDWTGGPTSDEGDDGTAWWLRNRRPDGDN